ncbi:hypothetical protein C8D82_13719 [Victivallis vadensis]|uniref:Uncharacterized protein n=2 Tax=Victivallis vadensis TaxID=172901 RepID=A0A2U1AI27_9BACT|nr:hypothetical protein C8D82_13719 [Victivallis vadensis]
MARKNMKQEVGTIYQKPNGTYHYRYQINGERKSISLKTKNLEEAKRKVKELLPVLKATNMEVVSAHVAHARNLIKPANVLPLTEVWNTYSRHPNRATPATINEQLNYEADLRDFLASRPNCAARYKQTDASGKNVGGNKVGLDILRVIRWIGLEPSVAVPGRKRK